MNRQTWVAVRSLARTYGGTLRYSTRKKPRWIRNAKPGRLVEWEIWQTSVREERGSAYTTFVDGRWLLDKPELKAIPVSFNMGERAGEVTWAGFVYRRRVYLPVNSGPILRYFSVQQSGEKLVILSPHPRDPGASGRSLIE